MNRTPVAIQMRANAPKIPFKSLNSLNFRFRTMQLDLSPWAASKQWARNDTQKRW